jgi:phosphatidylserine/phosphatidylglycerophosphate/cardiolipin synthase-like enzyme
VQIVRTAPVERAEPEGLRETSHFRAFVQAVDSARRFIYIEDQYFWPLINLRPNTDQPDLLDHLVRALQRGVDLFVVLPAPRRSNPLGMLAALQRHRAMCKLIHAQLPGAGIARFATPVRNRQPVYVHSKLTVVDDHVALIGSANVNARSMFHDGEVTAVIADPHTVQNFRARLWEEHLSIEHDRLWDYDQARLEFTNALSSRRGNLRSYRVPTSTRELSLLEHEVWQRVVDPGSVADAQLA